MGAVKADSGKSQDLQQGEESSEESRASSVSEEDEDADPIFFSVAVDEAFCNAEPTEQDVIAARCAALRERMRQRPTLPCKADGEVISVQE